MEEWAVVKTIWASNPDFIGAISKEFIHVGLREITENDYVTDYGKNIHTL
jgi:hypothetical protein